ncbi:hypothetical protein [Parasaccharibacter sp. TMW 2.1891]|uniref:hypothetical protein n=1 Tax=Parasaccharibacter sp. TMW 2.1891 TaxID=2267836 RepID=UPI0020117D0C|nr:hypothetical protein [Parasaccharibacter sp. TMW 2.1891]
MGHVTDFPLFDMILPKFSQKISHCPFGKRGRRRNSLHRNRISQWNNWLTNTLWNVLRRLLNGLPSDGGIQVGENIGTVRKTPRETPTLDANARFYGHTPSRAEPCMFFQTTFQLLPSCHGQGNKSHPSFSLTHSYDHKNG